MALKYLNSTKHVSGRLGRWNMILSNYKYKIEHTKGKDNVVADAISRIDSPAPETGVEQLLDEMLMSIDLSEDRTADDRTICTPTLWEINIVDTAETAASSASNTAAADTQQTAEQLKPDPCDLTETYDVSQLQEQCPDCWPLINYVRDGRLPTGDDGTKISF